jgi:membrane-bound lytic murein transglycosylase D
MTNYFSALAACLLSLVTGLAHGSLPKKSTKEVIQFPEIVIKSELKKNREAPLIFDLPMAYNDEVKTWVKYFQGPGRNSFKKWLERSNKYIPRIQSILQEEGLPRDLVYMAMIESGFSSHAVSSASAVGPWQFIQPTAERYGLKVNWWLDERKDFDKSTRAAAKYLKFLYAEFKAWYLVAAGYNTGENRIIRLIERHQTTNFWTLANRGALVDETKNYVPKLIAATLIAKAPNLYGFREMSLQEPLDNDYFYVPGGTDLKSVADHLGVTFAFMQELNPDLIRAYVPSHVGTYRIRIPKGSVKQMGTLFKRSVVLNDVVKSTKHE